MKKSKMTRKHGQERIINMSLKKTPQSNFLIDFDVHTFLSYVRESGGISS